MDFFNDPTLTLALSGLRAALMAVLVAFIVALTTLLVRLGPKMVSLGFAWVQFKIEAAQSAKFDRTVLAKASAVQQGDKSLETAVDEITTNYPSMLDTILPGKQLVGAEGKVKTAISDKIAQINQGLA